eukprot:403363677
MQNYQNSNASKSKMCFDLNSKTNVSGNLQNQTQNTFTNRVQSAMTQKSPKNYRNNEGIVKDCLKESVIDAEFETTTKNRQSNNRAPNTIDRNSSLKKQYKNSILDETQKVEYGEPIKNFNLKQKLQASRSKENMRYVQDDQSSDVNSFNNTLNSKQFQNKKLGSTAAFNMINSTNNQPQTARNTQNNTHNRTYQRIMQKTQNILNTSAGNSQNQSPKDNLKDKVYSKMFTHLMKARQKSPTISDNYKTHQQVKQSQNDSLRLKEYFINQEDTKQKQMLKTLNKSCSQRLIEKGQTYKLKKEILQKFDSIAEFNSCQFQPRTNKSNSPMRDIDQYLRDQESYELTKQRKIHEKLNQEEKLDLEKINSTHISRGSSKMVRNIDRYRQSPTPLDVSQNLYDLGKDKLLKKTHQMQELKHYIELKSQGKQNQYLQQSYSQSNLRDSQSQITQFNQSQIFNDSSFMPQINKKYHDLKRNDSVGNILYKDAMDRQRVNLEKSNSYLRTHQPEFISQKKSDKYIIDGYKKEFERVLQENDFKFVNIEEYLDFFAQLGFVQLNDSSRYHAKQLIEESQIFDMLQQSKNFQKNLFAIVLSIMNIYSAQDIQLNDSTMSSHVIHEVSIKKMIQDSNEQINHNDDYMSGQNLNLSHVINRKECQALQTMLQQQSQEYVRKGEMQFTQDQVKMIHKFFLPLYYNRKEFEQMRRRRSASPEIVQPTFKPTINTKTVKLADKVLKKLKGGNHNTSTLNNSRHFDILIQKGQHIQNKKEIMLKKKVDPNLSECSFKPLISDNTKKLAQSQSQKRFDENGTQSSKFVELHNEYKSKKIVRTDKTTEQIDYEKSLKELTFQPNRSGQNGSISQRLRQGVSSKQSRQVSNSSNSHYSKTGIKTYQTTQNLNQKKSTIKNEQSNFKQSQHDQEPQNFSGYLNNQSGFNSQQRSFQKEAEKRDRERNPDQAFFNQQSNISSINNTFTNQYINHSSTLNNEDDQQEPQYVIAIELEGQNFKINIFEGDKPQEVIQNFFKDKNLNDRVQQKIIKLITEQMQTSNLIINSPPPQQFIDQSSDSCQLRANNIVVNSQADQILEANQAYDHSFN